MASSAPPDVYQRIVEATSDAIIFVAALSGQT
jgi:hypothetical protein